MEKMWPLKTTTEPIILGARGIIKKGTDKDINKIPGSLSLFYFFVKNTKKAQGLKVFGEGKGAVLLFYVF